MTADAILISVAVTITNVLKVIIFKVIITIHRKNKTFAEAAAEIQELLEQLDKTYERVLIGKG